MSTIALELAITRAGATHAATLTARLPEADACLAAAPVTLDAETLRTLEYSPEAYGAALSAMVFPPPLREAWARACGASEGQQRPLRLGLALDASDDALHALLWETLRDPLSGLPLARGEAVRLARLLPGASLADLTPPPRPDLRAVVAASAAAPPGAPPVDRAGLAGAALAGLADIPATLLDGHAGRLAATLANLTAALRDGAPLLVLICHGALVQGEPYLWLDRADDGAVPPRQRRRIRRGARAARAHAPVRGAGSLPGRRYQLRGPARRWPPTGAGGRGGGAGDARADPPGHCSRTAAAALRRTAARWGD